ncbi:MAG: thioredoxin fold domain-containing protein [Cocleimonas sp.]|nr:thioredoxin fold domain-containing protein [Cocleimonas sp.]
MFKRIASLIIMFATVFSLVFATGASAEKEKKEGGYFGAKTATHPTWFKESFLDLEEDIADATSNNKRLVAYFWQPGCPYCSQLWEDNFGQQKIVDDFRKNFEIVALNMWGDREVVSVGGNDYTEKSFAEALGIKYTPTLLFFDENKKVVHQINGYIPPEDFQRSMNFVSGKHEKTQSFGAFSVQQMEADAGSKEGKLHGEDFFTSAPYDLNRSEKEGEDYLAVFFEAKNCKNCDLLHEKTLQNESARNLIKQFNAVQFDRFSDTKITTPAGKTITAKNWANDLGISYLPAMVFFNQEGKEVMRIDAQMRTFHIQSVFDYVLTGAYKTELNFQRYISARADKIREGGVDVDIFAY